MIEGDRRLTAPSVQKFIIGAGLTGEWKEYFRMLVALSEADSRPNGWTAQTVRDRMEVLRGRLSGTCIRSSKSQGQTLADRLLGVPQFFEIYAALGTTGIGAGLTEIEARTGLLPRVLEPALKKMEELGLLSWDREARHVMPNEFHLSVTDAGRSELFKRLFAKSLQRASKEAAAHMTSTEKLFHQSAFCVRKGDLEKLKTELRELVLSYVDAHIEPRGDQVVTLVTALF